jgi:hypothetical protein
MAFDQRPLFQAKAYQCAPFVRFSPCPVTAPSRSPTSKGRSCTSYSFHAGGEAASPSEHGDAKLTDLLLDLA